MNKKKRPWYKIYEQKLSMLLSEAFRYKKEEAQGGGEVHFLSFLFNSKEFFLHASMDAVVSRVCAISAANAVSRCQISRKCFFNIAFQSQSEFFLNLR